MKPRTPPKIQRPASRLAALEKPIVAVLPKGLPREVASFYAKSDGMRVADGNETAKLVGLAEMFGGLKKGAFRKHTPVKRHDLDERAWTDNPFYEQFFNEHAEVTDKGSLDHLNLRMRLKLLASVAGESVELAIDFFDRKPCIYLVQRADAAYPMRDLGFAEFVDWFSRFGTRRWYYAFLDHKAGAEMNIDLRAELQRALEDFPADTWAPLLARFPKRRAPLVRPQRVESSAASQAPVDRLRFPSTDEAPIVLEQDAPRDIAFSGDGRQLIVWDGNYDLSAFDVEARTRIWKTKKAHAFTPSPDGQTIAVSEMTHTSESPKLVVLRSSSTGKPLHRTPWKSPGAKGIDTFAFARGGKTVVIADDSGTIRIVDVESQREVIVIAHVDHVRRLGSIGASAHVIAHVQRFDPGEMVLEGPSVVSILDTETGADVCRWDQANAFAVSADGARVALRVSDHPSKVRVIELASGRVVKELAGGFTEPGVRSEYGFHMCFSPDGSLLVIAERLFDRATAKVAATLTVFDTETWSAVQRIDLGRDPNRETSNIDADAIAISRDNLLCIATDRGLRLWRL